MIAIDTNVLLRYLLNDDQRQAAIADKLINGTDAVLITDIVLVESVWTLKGKKYQLNKTDLIAVLNPTERYFSLLSAWWLRGNASIIGESDSDSRSSLNESLSFFRYALCDSKSLKKQCADLGILRYDPGFHNLALMELFGFIQIELDATVSKENWPIVDITTT